MSTIKNFEAMLARGQDSGLLRFGLGSAYLGQNDPERADFVSSRWRRHARNSRDQ